eukprot:280257-Chlamydomonas_euryale.AAC.1
MPWPSAPRGSLAYLLLEMPLISPFTVPLGQLRFAWCTARTLACHFLQLLLLISSALAWQNSVMTGLSPQGRQDSTCSRRSHAQNYYDAGGRHETFKLGTQVLLSTKNLNQLRHGRGTNKLMLEYVGPFAVTEQ